jgi:hypothetical protein
MGIKNPYNQFVPKSKKTEDDEVISLRAKKEALVSHDTREALRELESLSTWDDLGGVCETQRRKRGW